MNSRENYGIYGYGYSRRKKNRDELLGQIKPDSNNEKFSDEAREEMNESMQQLSDYMHEEEKRLATPIDSVEYKNNFVKSARNYLVPEDNELRRRRQFVMSDRGVKEATDDYYNNSVKGVFDSERLAADSAAVDEYKRYASVVGGDPVAATGAMRRMNDPAKVVGKTMQKIASEPLDSIADSYARYARISPEKYRENVLEPEIKQRMYREYIEDETPNSSMEYIARSAFDNSLTGKLVNYSLDGYAGSNNQSEINRRGLENYNANRLEKLGAGIGSLAIDMPAFSALGGFSSKVVNNIGNNVAKGFSKLLVNKYAAKGMQLPEAERIVERAIVGKIGAKIAQSSAQQGLTLGGYDAANSLADDLLANDGIDVEKAVDSFAHGFGTGTLLGVVGTPLKNMSRGLTGGKKMAASAGILGAESSVFTLGSTMEQAAAGVDVEPLDILYNFGESAATLGAMRLAHWRPKGAYAKLNSKGELKERFRLTSSEAEEIENAGINPREFVLELENSFNLNPRVSANSLESIKNKYLQLMSNDELSMSTRSKLLYLVENKVTSSHPMPVDYNVRQVADNNYRLSLLDADGRRIVTKKFTSLNKLNDYLANSGGELRKNKIANYENILLGKYDSENFFRQAGFYAKETGVGVDAISEAMYKKASGSQLSDAENKILSDISARSTYGDENVGYMLHDIRRRLERNYNLKEGGLLAAIDKKAYHCSDAENKALEEYTSIMRNEVESIVDGVSPSKMQMLENSRKGWHYGNNSNADIKNSERANYYNHINVPQEWNAPFAWNITGARNSVEDMRRYQARADELANKLGYKLDYIFDERDISSTDNPAEYNNKLSSSGWTDNNNGKVYINLPNIKNINELERTVVHEVVGHGGLPNLFGERIFDFYDDLYQRADNSVKAEIAKVKSHQNIDNNYMAMEEYLAQLAEKTAPTAKERTMLGRVKDFLKGMFARMDIYPYGNEKVSSEELVKLLTAHHESMMNNVAPNDYRASVFGRFPAARHSSSYYNSNNYDRAEDARVMDTAYRFIGKKGAKNLVRNNFDKYVGMANRDFDRAWEMEIEGANPADIWSATGWGRGADGKWRNERMDDKMSLNDVFLDYLKRKDPVDARIYESISKTPVSQRYASDRGVLKKIYDENRDFLKRIKVKDLINDEELFAAYPELGAMPVVISGKMKEPGYYNSRERKLYVNEDYLTNLPQLKEYIVMPIQQMIQHYEGFERGVNLLKADAEKYFKTEYNAAKESAENLIDRNDFNGFEELETELRNGFINEYGVTPERFKKDFPTLKDYMYNRVFKRKGDFAGNVELRNVYDRQLLNEEERARIKPWETEDTPRDRQFPLDFKKMRKTLSGPLDIIYNEIKKENSNRPMFNERNNNDFLYYSKEDVKKVLSELNDDLQYDIRDLMENYNPDKKMSLNELYNLLGSEGLKLETDIIRKLEMNEPKLKMGQYGNLLNIPGYKIYEKHKFNINDPYYDYIDPRKILREKYMKKGLDNDILDDETPELLN